MTAKSGSLSLPELACWNVLVVDDTRAALHLMSALLRKLGQAVETAIDGEQAVKIARTKPLDVIFSDIGMPGMDGYALARSLRDELPMPRPKLVALTGHGSEDDRVRALESGFDFHLPKPVSLAMLCSVLSQMQQAPAIATSPSCNGRDACMQ